MIALAIEIIKSAFFLIVGYFLHYFIEKFIFIRPKIYMTLNLDSRGQEVIIPNKLFELDWQYNLILKNNSKYDAYDISFHYQNGNQIFDYIDKLEKHNHISSKDKLSIKVKWLRKISYEEANTIKDEDKYKILIPDKAKNFNLVISYKNDKGKTFYTLYSKHEIEKPNKFYLLNPFQFKIK